MSQAPQEISNQEIDARIMALIAQRNRAFDENVILAGQVTLLQVRIKELENQLKQVVEVKVTDEPANDEGFSK